VKVFRIENTFVGERVQTIKNTEGSNDAIVTGVIAATTRFQYPNPTQKGVYL